MLDRLLRVYRRQIPAAPQSVDHDAQRIVVKSVARGRSNEQPVIPDPVFFSDVIRADPQFLEQGKMVGDRLSPDDDTEPIVQPVPDLFLRHRIVQIGLFNQNLHHAHQRLFFRTYALHVPVPFRTVPSCIRHESGSVPIINDSLAECNPFYRK